MNADRTSTRANPNGNDSGAGILVKSWAMRQEPRTAMSNTPCTAAVTRSTSHMAIPAAISPARRADSSATTSISRKPSEEKRQCHLKESAMACRIFIHSVTVVVLLPLPAFGVPGCAASPSPLMSPTSTHGLPSSMLGTSSSCDCRSAACSCMLGRCFLGDECTRGIQVWLAGSRSCLSRQGCCKPPTAGPLCSCGPVPGSQSMAAGGHSAWPSTSGELA
mmetsp:Transcript_26306/g.73829  ORF Transcript_26306/g.73829 Transcript_26306/m.73829 type:complete len:220 (+) Transcript_26306:706-1365(+)